LKDERIILAFNCLDIGETDLKARREGKGRAGKGRREGEDLRSR
jgi:hypothetical protein